MEAIAVEAREIAGIEPALRIDRLGREIGGAVVPRITLRPRT